MIKEVIIDAEDRLTEEVAKRLIANYEQVRAQGEPTVHDGKTDIESSTAGFNESALYYDNSFYHLVLIDFDATETADKCVAQEISALLKGRRKSPQLLLRIAVAEVENWLLADWTNLREFLEIKREQPPWHNIDKITNSKEVLLNLVQRKAPPRMRKALCPSPSDATALTGPEYNSKMTEFIRDKWQPRQAAKHSRSLARTIHRLDKHFKA